MPNKAPLDEKTLLSRGGALDEQELACLARQSTGSKLIQLQAAILARSVEQPVKVVRMKPSPPHEATGYFTQESFLLGKTPQEMERILGILGEFRPGAYVLSFKFGLSEGDYENRAYTYLPDGKPVQKDSQEKKYIQGYGAPQWRLTGAVPAEVIAELQPGEPYSRIIAPLAKMNIRYAIRELGMAGGQVTSVLNPRSSPMGGAYGKVRSLGTRMHDGWDLYAPVGTPARAVCQGRVYSIPPPSSGLGKCIVVRLGESHAQTLAKAKKVQSLYAVYGHLSVISVQENEPVWAGKRIGLTGNTGNACNTPPHLHFELRTSPEPHHTIDPGELMGFGYYRCSV